MDRWDPVAARVGDAWDTSACVRASTSGRPTHHPTSTRENLSDLADYWPGEFSETWVYAPERSAAGVLRALRAGSFFADHGRIVREVELRVNTDGLPRAAGAGESISVAPDATLVAQVTFQVPPTAWRSGPNHIDLVELIGIDQSGAKVLAQGAPETSGRGADLHRACAAAGAWSCARAAFASWKRGRGSPSTPTRSASSSIAEVRPQRTRGRTRNTIGLVSPPSPGTVPTT